MDNNTTFRHEPLTDTVFNYLFAEKTLKSAAGEMINAVLQDAGDTTVEAVEDIKTQYDVQKRIIGAHGGRLDVRAIASDGSLFDIEVQTYPEPAMNARSWFYGSNLMSEEFKEGQPYREIPRVRIINILDFSLRPNHPDLLQPIGLLYRKTPEEATDAFRIYNVELPKFRALKPTLESVKDNALLRWLYLLDVGYKDEREMEVLSKMTEGMSAFARRYNVSLNDPDLRRMYDLEMSAKRDQASALDNAERKGIAQGMAQGMAQGTATAYYAVVRRALSQNLPMDVIYALVDAPRSEVDAIIAKVRAEGKQ